jgi:pilus assembly protein Flp/PilA
MLESVYAHIARVWYAGRNDESGQGLVEYALIIALVSLAAVAALGFLSDEINDLFSRAGNELNDVNP